MPNIFKAFSRVKAESYQFPKAEELVVEPEPGEEQPAPEESPPEVAEGLDIRVADPEPEAEAEPESEPEENPVSYAQLQAEVILADARREAEELMAKARADAKREAEEIAARGRRSAEERQARLASVAQLDARKLELAAKQEMLAKAYDRAMERLTSLPDEEYVGLLAGLAAEASSTGREEVILSQKDRARYGKQVVTQANERLGDGHLTLSVQTRPIRGGLILSDGDVEVNCTFETLVRLLRGEMDRTVVEVLFG